MELGWVGWHIAGWRKKTVFVWYFVKRKINPDHQLCACVFALCIWLQVYHILGVEDIF